MSLSGKILEAAAPIPDDEQLNQAMIAHEWTDDPGTGRAILLPDGRELLNPTPVAPPAHIAAYSQEMSVNDLVNRALARHAALLRGEDEIDTEEDMNDFPEDEEYHPITGYEVVMLEDTGPPEDRPVVEQAAVSGSAAV